MATTMLPEIEEVEEAPSAVAESTSDYVDYKTLCLGDYVDATQRLLGHLPVDSSAALEIWGMLIEAEKWTGDIHRSKARAAYESALAAVRQRFGYKPVVEFNAALPRKPKHGRRVAA